MIVTVAIVICALIALKILLKRLLLPLLVIICLAGAAFSQGLVAVSQVISGPIEHLQTEVHTWQATQSLKLSCAVQAARAAEAAGAPEPSSSCSKAK